MPVSTLEPEPRPSSPLRLRRLPRPERDHLPEEDLELIREVALFVADQYVSRDVPREYREILVGRSALR